MPHTSNPEDIHQKPVGEVVEDIMQQSRSALESGARATAELEDLKQRADDALDWRKQLDRHSWLAMGLAMGVSILLFMALAPRR